MKKIWCMIDLKEEDRVSNIHMIPLQIRVNQHMFTIYHKMAHSMTLLLVLTLCNVIAHAAPLPPPPPPPPPPLSSSATEYLEAHNQARTEVGVGPLKWSEVLANATSRLVRYQRDRMGCQFANLTNSKYGGNQLWASGTAVTPLMVVSNWVQEKSYYNYGNNTCVGDHQCGVYTQVVWKKSMELGCAQATCKKEQTSLTICFYNPPGNIIGERPY